MHQVSQVELGKATKNIYNLPPPPLFTNKLDNQKLDNRNENQNNNSFNGINDTTSKSFEKIGGAERFRGAARGVVKNPKNVPSKAVRATKQTQVQNKVYICE